MTLSSTAFGNLDKIPVQFTCDTTGAAVSPPLSWSGVPKSAGWLALYVHDRTGDVMHWTVVNIKPSVTGVAAGGQDSLGGPVVVNWLPMCPGTGNTDEYDFFIYAEPASYHLPKIGPSWAVDPDALAAHAVGAGELVGFYH